MAKAKYGDDVDALGMVAVACSEVGQLVSLPVGTSEIWYANCAVPDGASATGDGPAFAWGEMLTVNPSTTVTVRGAPLPENSPIVG
jgi:hypothetical protein